MLIGENDGLSERADAVILGIGDHVGGGDRHGVRERRRAVGVHGCRGDQAILKADLGGVQFDGDLAGGE